MLRIKSNTLEVFILPIILIVLLLLPHFLFLNNGYVDLESYCVETSLGISKYGFTANLSNYYHYIANPIFSNLILSGIYKLFGESPLISRMSIFMLSVVFSLFLYFYIKNKRGVFIASVATLFVIVNPMFIIYSQYVYSDIPCMILTSIALILLLFNSSWKEYIISSIALGISLATKYTAILLFPVVFSFSLINSKLSWHYSRAKLLTLSRFNIWYFALSLSVSVPILLIILNYQTNAISSNYEVLFTSNFAMFIPRLFSYLLWLGLFVGPFSIISLFDLLNKVGKVKLLILFLSAVVITLVVIHFFPISSLHAQGGKYGGEMNLGWVEIVIPDYILSPLLYFVIIAAELFVASLIFDLKHHQGEKINKLFLWIVLPILLASFTRCANRYMLLVLVPISIYMAFVCHKIYSNNKRPFTIFVITIHAIIFLSMGFYSNYYLYLRGL